MPSTLSVTALHGQESLDSLRETIGSTAEKVNFDSTSQRLIQLSDTLLPAFRKIDSIRQDFNVAADSIQNEYQSALTKLDARTKEVNGKIDSLSRLNLPTEKYMGKLDSLAGSGRAIQSRLTSKLEDLKSKTTEKLNGLGLPPEYQNPINDLTQKINGLSLNPGGMKLPELQISRLLTSGFERTS